MKTFFSSSLFLFASLNVFAQAISPLVDLTWGVSHDVVDFSRWQSAGAYGCPDNEALVGFYVKSSGYPYVNDKIRCAAPNELALQVCFSMPIPSEWSSTPGAQAECPANFFIKNITTSGGNSVGAWTDIECCTWPFVHYDPAIDVQHPNWVYNNSFVGVENGQYIKGLRRTSTSSKFQSIGEIHAQQSIE